MMIARILLAGVLIVATTRQSSLDVSASVVAPNDGRDIEDAANASRVQPLRVASPDTLGGAPEWTQQRAQNFLQPPSPTHPLIYSSNHPDITLRTSRIAVNPNARLGTNFANYYKTDGQRAYADMHNAGASNDRVTFNMTALNPSQGVFEWSAYDALVTDATAANIQTLGVLIVPTVLNNQIFWACDPAALPPMNQPLPAFCMPKLDAWSDFAMQVVSRYKDRVKAWEVWNEPNLSEFFTASPAQFAQLVRAAYLAIKAADPQATVVLGSIFRGVDQTRIADIFRELKNLPDSAANNYFHDVIGFHLYDGGHCSTFDEIGYIRAVLWGPFVGDKPMWVTESGIIVSDTLSIYALPTESASFVVSNYAYALYNRAERFYYWRAIDTEAEEASRETWGLLRRTGVARPSLAAYQTVAQYLPQQFEWAVRRFSPNNAVNRFTFYNTPLGRVSVIYNITNTAQTFTFTTVLSNITLVQPDGLQFSTSSSGQYIFNLPPAPNFRWNHPEGICRVSSPPTIVIERDTTPPTSTLASLTITSTSPLNLSWTSADEPGGSGVWWHEVQYRNNTGEWQMLSDEVLSTTLPFTGTAGTTYAFRVRARDRAGNIPDWSTSNIVTTTIGGALPPNLPNRAWIPIVLFER